MTSRDVYETARDNVYYAEYHLNVVNTAINMIDQLMGDTAPINTREECFDTIRRRCAEFGLEEEEQKYLTLPEVREVFTLEKVDVQTEFSNAQLLLEYADALNRLEPNRAVKLYRHVEPRT